ncbi:ABC transporter family substrate-binding protein [Dermabacteraceae bacterium P13138]
MQLTRRTLIGATAATAVGLAVAGCTKAGSGGANAGAAGEGKAIAANVNDINPLPREELADGGTLRLVVNSFVPNWNVFHQDGNETNTNSIVAALYPSLVQSNAKGELSPNPSYLKRMEIVSENPFTVEAELNEGMKWSDGTPIDYKSIENVFRISSGKEEGYQILTSEGYDKVTKIEPGANERTARITFSEVYPDWTGLLGVMPDALAASPEEFNSGWLDGPKVTAGPFKVGAIDKANKTVTLERDENWFGEKPALQRVLWTSIEDSSAAVTAFKAGQLDSLEASVPAQYTVLKGDIGNTAALRKAAGPNWTHLTLNGEKERPFGDKVLRQAFFRAVPREEVFLTVNAVMPYPKDVKQLNNRLLMTNQEGYKDNSEGRGEYDIEAAKKILADGGYTFDGEGRAVKDGKPVEVTYVYNDGSKANEAILPVVQDSLKKAGITLKVQKVPPSDLFSKYIIPGNYDVSMFRWTGTPYLSSGNAIWRSNGGLNLSRIGTPEIDKLIDQSSVEVDREKRLELLNQTDAQLWDLATVLPLWQTYTFQVQHPDLANYGAFGFETVDWTKVGYKKGSPKAAA